MKRRSFILLSGLSISAVGIALIDVFDLAITDENLYAKPALLSELCDDRTIEAIGNAFLQLKPFERSRRALTKTLYGRPVNANALGQQEFANLRAQLEESIRNDFDTGNTVILKGWVLSMTEARQCALYSILNS